MYLSIISTCMLLFAAFQISHGHVRLTFPPARFPDYDFLDNVRTGGPCGVPGKYSWLDLYSDKISNLYRKQKMN